MVKILTGIIDSAGAAVTQNRNLLEKLSATVASTKMLHNTL